MSFEGMSDKQLRERLRFLTDKIDKIWEDISPKLKEFRESRDEFNTILSELVDRGAITNEHKTESREETG